MPRPKNDLLHEQRQEQILSAASRVFKRKGFHGARTEHICLEAGLSAGTVFRHFPDKQSMIAGIARHELAHYQSEVQRLATRDGLQWLSRMDKADLAELLKPSAYDLGADAWLELSRSETGRSELFATDRKLRSTFARALARGQKEGWVRGSLDPKGAANIILALISGLMLDSEIGLDTIDQSTAKAFADLLSRFVRVDGDATAAAADRKRD
jgi:TetR/AcrR family transcriptional repressor of uid operon